MTGTGIPGKRYMRVRICRCCCTVAPSKRRCHLLRRRGDAEGAALEMPGLKTLDVAEISSRRRGDEQGKSTKRRIRSMIRAPVCTRRRTVLSCDTRGHRHDLITGELPPPRDAWRGQHLHRGLLPPARDRLNPAASSATGCPWHDRTQYGRRHHHSRLLQRLRRLHDVERDAVRLHAHRHAGRPLAHRGRPVRSAMGYARLAGFIEGSGLRAAGAGRCHFSATVRISPN